MIQSKIDCPRFCGLRPAANCCVDDRFRSCRKNCKPLAKFLEENPDFPQKAVEYFDKKKMIETSQWSCIRMVHANKGLPKKINPELKCPKCKFVALSHRGLKSHMTRNHKKTA